MPSGRQSSSEYRYHTAVPTRQVHKSMRARDERWQSVSSLTAYCCTNTTSTQEHAFRATGQEEEEEQARDERWQRVVSSLTAEPYEDTRRASPAQSSQARTSINTILLLYQHHTNECRYHTDIVPRYQVPYCCSTNTTRTSVDITWSFAKWSPQQ